MLSLTQVSTQPVSLVTPFEEGRQSPPSLQAFHATKSKPWEGGGATPLTYASDPNLYTLQKTSHRTTRTSRRRPWHPRGSHRLTSSIPRQSGLSKERRDPRQPSTWLHFSQKDRKSVV